MSQHYCCLLAETLISLCLSLCLARSLSVCVCVSVCAPLLQVDSGVQRQRKVVFSPIWQVELFIFLSTLEVYAGKVSYDKVHHHLTKKLACTYIEATTLGIASKIGVAWPSFLTVFGAQKLS